MKIPIGNQGFSVANAERGANANPEAFGAGIGNAMQRVGNAGMQVANDMRAEEERLSREAAAEAKRILGELTNMDLSGFDTSQLIVVARDADIAFSSIAQAQEELRVATQATTLAQEQQNETMAQANELAALEERDAALARSAQQITEINRQGIALADTFSAGAISGGFFDPSQLSQVQMEAQAIADEYERIKALGEESEFSLVSEADVERARIIAEQADTVANNAERNAAAWEKASLAMIAGASGGGRENEFNQRVLANIEDPEERAAMERQMNLNSGVENANTDVLNYGEQLVGSIYAEQGIAAGAEASETFVRAFEEGIMAGLSGEELKTYIEGEVGYALSGEAGSSGAEITVQSGEGYIALAERTGRSREELEAATGGGMLQVGQVITLDDGSALIAIGENASPQDIASGILGNAQQSITPLMGTGGDNGYSSFDPVTGQVSTSYDPSAEQQAAAFIPPELAETTSMMADDMLAIETSVSTISQTDVSGTLDPMVADMDTVNTELNDFESGLRTLTTAEWEMEVPLKFVFDTQTAEMLSRNSQVVETVRLILPQLGITPS